MSNRRARARRPQSQKPNRHVERVQGLRRSSAASPHVVHSEDRSVRRYGMRAILKTED
jgi:hypothetical protein